MSNGSLTTQLFKINIFKFKIKIYQEIYNIVKKQFSVIQKNYEKNLLFRFSSFVHIWYFVK